MVKDEIFGKLKRHPTAYIDDMAFLVGEIIVRENVIIAPGASVRADECAPFYIGKGTNIQDGVILHGLLNQFVQVKNKQYSIWIGSHCSIAHQVLIHGPCCIYKKCFIGPQSQVWASHLGRNTFIGAQALIKNSKVGQRSYVGDRAAVKGVSIPNGRYVKDFQIVSTQKKADNLPSIPNEFQKMADDFNHHVVDLNKELVQLYKAGYRKK